MNNEQGDQLGRPCINGVGTMTRAVNMVDGSASSKGIGGKHVGITSWLDLWEERPPRDGHSSGDLQEHPRS
jgi:hypothetical protein